MMQRIRFRKAAVVAFCVSLCVATTSPGEQAQVLSTGPLPAELESRLRAIYKTKEFTAKDFGAAQWLKDSSGFTTLESSTGKDGKDEDGKDLVRYEASTGKREVLVSASQLVPHTGAKPLAIDAYSLSAD